MVSPYFSPHKHYFSHRPLKSDDLFFSYRLLTTSTSPPSNVVGLLQKIISFGCHPLDGVTRGGP